MDMLYGIHPVFEALRAERRHIKRIVLSKGRSEKEIRKIVLRAEALHVPVQYENDRFFRTQLKKVVHQGVAAETTALPLEEEGTIIKRASERNEPPLIVALDGVEDPQNLGSIIRSALAMGVHGMILTKARSAPLSATVSKASSGAMEHMLFTKVSNLVASLDRFKKKGCWVIGTDATSGTPIDDSDFNVGVVLVVGGEGKGMRPLVRKTCDLLISIPQNSCLDSLNAAVAAAIVLYEVTRQRRGGGRTGCR